MTEEITSILAIPEEDAIQILQQADAITEGQARFRLALMRGDIKSDEGTDADLGDDD